MDSKFELKRKIKLESQSAASKSTSPQEPRRQSQATTIDRRYIDRIRARLENLDTKTQQGQFLTLEQDTDLNYATITITGLKTRNALTGKMISRLTDILDQLYEWAEDPRIDCPLLLVMGDEGNFCSGSDLVGVKQSVAQKDSGFELSVLMQYNLMRLQLLPMFSVSFIQGYALGGGAELALATDMRIMSENARIGFVHSKVGVCCGWGGARRLVNLVGRARAADLLASGRLVGPREAKEMGLSNETIDSVSQFDRAELIAWIVSHAKAACPVVASTKILLDEASLGAFPLSQHQQQQAPKADDPASMVDLREAKLFNSLWGTELHLKALEDKLKHRE